jgi:hypothetical protein
MKIVEKLIRWAPGFVVRRCRGVRLVLRVLCGAAVLGAAAIFVAGCGVWLALAGGALLVLSEAFGQGARVLAPLEDMLFGLKNAPQPEPKQLEAGAE